MDKPTYVCITFDSPTDSGLVISRKNWYAKGSELVDWQHDAIYITCGDLIDLVQREHERRVSEDKGETR
jgi:hypothetical protein